MPKPAPIEFSNATLTRSAERVASRFENFKTSLEQTSSDIKKLEDWLQQCGVCIPAFVQMSEFEHIGWDKVGSSWRLVFENSAGASPETRPLADTPIKVRFEARRHLSDLVDEIGRLIPDADGIPDTVSDEQLINLFGEPDDPAF